MFNFNQYIKNQRESKSEVRQKFLAHNTLVGNYGEKFVKRLLRDSGYLARKPRKKRFCGDLWTYSIQTEHKARIEVKTAIESATGTYCFCLRKDGHTDCGHSDYVILLCIDKYSNHYIYCIPSFLLQTQCIKITSHPNKYSGKFAAFLVRGQVDFHSTNEVTQLWIQ